jgi:diguanylate cyclase (GGDEF)-like protein
VLTDELAAAALDALPSFVAIVAADGTVVRLNEAWRRSAATGLAVVPVRPGGSWFAACDAAAERVAAIHTLASLTRQILDHRRDRARIEIGHPTPRGRRWLEVRLRPMSGTGGLVVVVDDVTDRHEREEVLRHRATHDAVTGLANRLAIRDMIGEALAVPTPASAPTPAPNAVPDPDLATRPAPGPTPEQGQVLREPGAHRAAVVFLDLDGFRRVNQTFGYTTGDSVLRGVGERLAAALNPGSRLARWGGDEFVVLANDITSSGAASLAENLAASLDDPLTVAGHQINVSASVGLALSGSLPDVSGETRPAPAARAADADMLIRLASEELVRARTRRRRHRRPRP